MSLVCMSVCISRSCAGKGNRSWKKETHLKTKKLKQKTLKPFEIIRIKLKNNRIGKMKNFQYIIRIFE